MVFSSPTFLFCFFPIVFAGYFICPLKGRNAWLLGASLFFYAWSGVSFFPIIIYSILVNYLFGIWIEKAGNSKIHNFLFIMGLSLNLCNLIYWKYANFLMENVQNWITVSFQWEEVLLPIGISFYTFQGLSYLIDVYKQKTKAQKNLGSLALYISFFPQLIAGPIVRYTDIEEAIQYRIHSIDAIKSGLTRFVIGLSKKAILANTVGKIASEIFDTPCNQNTPIIAWIGAIAYTLQIYFDFSGYSDMAIGLGEIFGFHFPKNFNYPYMSKSITEFWRRWHITLSSWFRDYVYIPMGGNRSGNVYWHLFVVFLLTGVWHGAAWNFVIWGIYYSFFIILERYWKGKISVSIPAIICHLYTMIVVIVGWVLFNARNLSHALEYIRSMFGLLVIEKPRFTYEWYLDKYTGTILFLAIVGCFPILKNVWVKGTAGWNERLKQVFLEIATVLLLMLSIAYVMTTTYNPFIYFQF